MLIVVMLSVVAPCLSDLLWLYVFASRKCLPLYRLFCTNSMRCRCYKTFLPGHECYTQISQRVCPCKAKLSGRARGVTAYLSGAPYSGLTYRLETLQRPASDKYPNLLGTFVNYGCKKLCKIGSSCKCYKTFYGRNLRMFEISQSVCPSQAFPAQSNKHSSLV